MARPNSTSAGQIGWLLPIGWDTVVCLSLSEQFLAGEYTSLQGSPFYLQNSFAFVSYSNHPFCKRVKMLASRGYQVLFNDLPSGPFQNTVKIPCFKLLWGCLKLFTSVWLYSSKRSSYTHEWILRAIRKQFFEYDLMSSKQMAEAAVHTKMTPHPFPFCLFSCCPLEFYGAEQIHHHRRKCLARTYSVIW